MTFRSRLLALPALAGLFLGMLREQPLLSLLSLSVLLWLLSEACYFCWRLWIELPRLTVHRTINGRTDSGGVLWAGRTVIVTVRMTMRSFSMSPLVLLKDVLPENLELIPFPAGLPPQSAIQPSEILSPASVTGSELLLKSRVGEVQWSYGCFRVWPLHRWKVQPGLRQRLHRMFAGVLPVQHHQRKLFTLCLR